MRVQKLILFVFCILSSTLVFSSEITIDASELQGGIIPDGYDRVNVTIANGYTQLFLYLPFPDKYMEVSVSSDSGFTTNVKHERMIIDSVPVNRGDFVEFQYFPDRNVWRIIKEDVQTFSTVGDRVQLDGSAYVQYLVSNGDDYTNVVKLPIVDDNETSEVIVNIKSTADQPTEILEDSDFLEHNVHLKKYSDLHFKYNVDYKKWHLVREFSYFSRLDSQDIENGLIPEGLPNLIEVVISDASFTNVLTLPENSYKGQTISIKNETGHNVQIEVSSNKPKYTVAKGERYVFAYEEITGWQPLSMPEFIYDDLTVFN